MPFNLSLKLRTFVLVFEFGSVTVFLDQAKVLEAADVNGSIPYYGSTFGTLDW